MSKPHASHHSYLLLGLLPVSILSNPSERIIGLSEIENLPETAWAGFHFLQLHAQIQTR